MLHIFPKIAFLLFSLSISGLNADHPLYTSTCNGGIRYYTGGKMNVACRYAVGGEEKHYNCKKENCQYDRKGKGYSCTTANDVKYHCPNATPDNVGSLLCEHCRAGNW
ncbi:secreted protein [Melampsora americana]|nr:secreted protein [Melampsora americana]